MQWRGCGSEGGVIPKARRWAKRCGLGICLGSWCQNPSVSGFTFRFSASKLYDSGAFGRIAWEAPGERDGGVSDANGAWVRECLVPSSKPERLRFWFRLGKSGFKSISVCKFAVTRLTATVEIGNNCRFPPCFADGIAAVRARTNAAVRARTDPGRQCPGVGNAGETCQGV